jgi:hypothetical protein
VVSLTVEFSIRVGGEKRRSPINISMPLAAPQMIWPRIIMTLPVMAT